MVNKLVNELASLDEDNLKLSRNYFLIGEMLPDLNQASLRNLPPELLGGEVSKFLPFRDFRNYGYSSRGMLNQLQDYASGYFPFRLPLDWLPAEEELTNKYLIADIPVQGFSEEGNYVIRYRLVAHTYYKRDFLSLYQVELEVSAGLVRKIRIWETDTYNLDYHVNNEGRRELWAVLVSCLNDLSVDICSQLKRRLFPPEPKVVLDLDQMIATLPDPSDDTMLTTLIDPLYYSPIGIRQHADGYDLFYFAGNYLPLGEEMDNFPYYYSLEHYIFRQVSGAIGGDWANRLQRTIREPINPLTFTEETNQRGIGGSHLPTMIYQPQLVQDLPGSQIERASTVRPETVTLSQDWLTYQREDLLIKIPLTVTWPEEWLDSPEPSLVAISSVAWLQKLGLLNLGPPIEPGSFDWRFTNL